MSLPPAVKILGVAGILSSAFTVLAGFNILRDESLMAAGFIMLAGNLYAIMHNE